MLALRGEDDGAALGLAIERVEHVADRAHQRHVEEVVRRPLDLDGGDRTVEIDSQVLVVAELGHEHPPVNVSGRVYIGGP